MSEPHGVSVREALLQRLRFERNLGIESVPRVAATLAGAVSEHPVPETASSPTDSAPPAVALVKTPPRATTSVAVADQPATASPVEVPAEKDAGGGAASSREERWEALRQRALACTNCPLHRGRKTVVFGEGPCPARLVFVGEGPGADEDRTGRPFVGKAGQLLDKIIGAMGFKREEVYIANVVKCRPPENRTPLPDETAACWPFLEEQLTLLEPKAIVALGSPAAKTLLKTSSGIMSLRGRWQLYRGIRVMPTYHPAFVLRQYTSEIRGHVWSDMQQVMQFLKEST
jgi:uracil-DNA glycosylase